MLYGRRAECDALDRLLADARRSRSGVLVVRGEAGVGKSALLDHAAGQAKEMTVLRAAGVESEADLPFAALHQLLRPVLGLAGRLPGHQAAALAGALGLEPPGDGGTEGGPGGSSLAPGRQGPVSGLGGRAQPARRGGRRPPGARPGRRGSVAGPVLGRGAGLRRLEAEGVVLLSPSSSATTPPATPCSPGPRPGPART